MGITCLEVLNPVFELLSADQIALYKCKLAELEFNSKTSVTRTPMTRLLWLNRTRF